MQLQISNPDMQDIFETKFHSNQEKFLEFIITFVQENKKTLDSYFQKSNKPDIKYKKMNPMENYYTLPLDKGEVEISNPFQNVTDSVSFAKELREKSYR